MRREHADRCDRQQQIDIHNIIYTRDTTLELRGAPPVPSWLDALLQGSHRRGLQLQGAVPPAAARPGGLHDAAGPEQRLGLAQSDRAPSRRGARLPHELRALRRHLSARRRPTTAPGSVELAPHEHRAPRPRRPAAAPARLRLTDDSDPAAGRTRGGRLLDRGPGGAHQFTGAPLQPADRRGGGRLEELARTGRKPINIEQQTVYEERLRVL
ncbi:unnamed protein product [Trichogramma brassicae]|uniref:Uncharacterized protein n=1 Tax=Trichogramma brassicae TaxID=86971 RepID=A0A6H5IVS4_9HYME|nr:unnamed protein product [Trichogramma brassicae]